MSSRFTNDSMDPPLCGILYISHGYNAQNVQLETWKTDGDINLDEQEEKARLIAQVMELQNTLDGKMLPCYVHFPT